MRDLGCHEETATPKMPTYGHIGMVLALSQCHSNCTKKIENTQEKLKKKISISTGQCRLIVLLYIYLHRDGTFGR